MLTAARRPFFLAMAFSLVANVLLLVSPIHMLQVYDRVLTSGSRETLLSLSLICAFLLVIYGVAEGGRRRALAWIGNAFSQHFGRRLARQGLHSLPSGNKPALSDLSRVEALFSQGQIVPLLDLPFSPLFLGVLFILHPVIGFIGLAGTVLLICLAIGAEVSSRGAVKSSQSSNGEVQKFYGSIVTSRGALVALGLTDRMLDRWQAKRATASFHGLTANGRTSYWSSATKSVRQVLQILVLSTGAYLALKQSMSPGGIVAGSILMGRALAPIDQIVASWRNLVLARESWGKLHALPNDTDQDEGYVALGAPEGPLECYKLAIAPPGTTQPLFPAFNISFKRGQTYIVKGESGIGKSTLLKTLTGAWQPLDGYVRISGVNLSTWPENDRGQYFGYLPQDNELLPGTIAENISRFDDDKVGDAPDHCKELGVHGIISSIPKQYDAAVEAGGTSLSGGQRKAIAIARAFFGAPAILLLDEPTANLDDVTSAHVMTAIKRARDNGTIVIASTHDERLLSIADHLITCNREGMSLASRSAEPKLAV